jgi:hypothetical protein
MTLTWLTQAYVRRMKFEGLARMAALGEQLQGMRQDRISPEAMIMRMGGI